MKHLIPFSTDSIVKVCVLIAAFMSPVSMAGNNDDPLFCWCVPIGDDVNNVDFFAGQCEISAISVKSVCDISDISV